MYSGKQGTSGIIYQLCSNISRIELCPNVLQNIKTRLKTELKRIKPEKQSNSDEYIVIAILIAH